MKEMKKYIARVLADAFISEYRQGVAEAGYTQYGFWVFSAYGAVSRRAKERLARNFERNFGQPAPGLQVQVRVQEEEKNIFRVEFDGGVFYLRRQPKVIEKNGWQDVINTTVELPDKYEKEEKNETTIR